MLGMYVAMCAMGNVGTSMFDFGDGNRVTPDSFSGKPHEVLPNGTQRYYFDDGWSTIASSQKSANKKYDKHLAKQLNLQ